MALTDAWLKATMGKYQVTRIDKTDRDGLSARVSTRGTIVFQMRYRHDGVPKRLKVGTYPKMSLKQARDENIRLRGELERGHDPANVKNVEKVTAVKPSKFKDVFNEWYEKRGSTDSKNPEAIKRTFEIHVLPKIGHLPFKSVDISMWISLMEEITAKTPSIGARVLVQAKKIYKWAMRRHIAEINPVVDLSPREDFRIEKVSTDRVLNDEELSQIWEAIDGSRMARKNKLFVKLCLLFACRTGELRMAEKGHFDYETGVWTIPPENHKTGPKTKEPILRPIIPEVEIVLREVSMLSNSRKWMFTNDKTSGHMTKSSPIALPYNIMQWVRKHKGVDMDHWSMHDLRRTARTRLSVIAEPHIAEIMLGHTLPKIWKIYDKHTYLKEQREAYEEWYVELTKIVGEF